MDEQEENEAFRTAVQAAAIVLREEDVGAMLVSVCDGKASEGLAQQCEREGAEDSAEQAARWRARRDVERALLPIVRRLAGPLPKPLPTEPFPGFDDDGVPF